MWGAGDGTTALNCGRAKSQLTKNIQLCHYDYRKPRPYSMDSIA